MSRLVRISRQASGLTGSLRCVSGFSRMFTTTPKAWHEVDTRKTSVASSQSPQVLNTRSLVTRKYNYTKPEDTSLLKECTDRLYAIVHIHDRRFLVTVGDVINIPVEMSDLQVGDVLRFDQVSEIGSNQHTLKGESRIDPSVFSVKGLVIEKTRLARKILEQTKQRQRHVRHVVVQPKLTRIRVTELKMV